MVDLKNVLIPQKDYEFNIDFKIRTNVPRMQFVSGDRNTNVFHHRFAVWDNL